MIVDHLWGVFLPLALALMVGSLAARRAPTTEVRRLLWIGLGLHLVGALVYLGVHEVAYSGGDYMGYYQAAIGALGDPMTGQTTMIHDAYDGVWNGTTATAYVTWGIALVLGRSLVGQFLVFGTISFLGVVWFGIAFERAFPRVEPTSYYRWLMLFPSLWFWPSPLGKDALVLAGVGLVTMGFVGRMHRQWLYVAAGLVIVVAIRAQYALVLVAALAAATLLGSRPQAGAFAKALTLAVVLGATAYALPLINEILGLNVTETEAVSEWIDRRGEVTAYGGSSYEAASNPVTGIVTSLFRPFPWEANGLLMLAASAELLLMWGLVFRRRRDVFAFVRAYWKAEPFMLAVCFTLLLAAAVGMAVGNFGTLVRQRVHVYPFLFMIVAGYPRVMAFSRFPRPTPHLATPYPSA